MMESSVRKFFERYEDVFNQSLHGDVDLQETTTMFASEFIAASPSGVMAGKNDEELKQAMAQGYERYRDTGVQQMRIRNLRLTSLDAHHCIAHVAWTATYLRKDGSSVDLDFDVHYFMQKLDGQPKVFGWVSGDEQALLEAHGII